MAEALPTVQRAAQIHTFGEALALRTAHPVSNPTQLQPNECLVKIEYAGVCHTDLDVRDGDFKLKPILPRIGGHEGVGVVVAIGAGTVDSPVSLGDRVGLKFCARTCLNCEECHAGNELLCSAISSHGFTTDGTFAEYTIAWTDYVTPIPKAIDGAAATPILCGGVTAYKGLKRIDAPPGSWVAIPGAGGGLGHLAIQYATAMGYRVIAIDSGEKKRALCHALGAEKWVDFKESGDALVANVIAAADGVGPQAALVVAGAATSIAQACFYVRKTGTIVLIGIAPSGFQVPCEFIAKECLLVPCPVELKLIGSVGGSRQDVIEALKFVATGKVKCHYTIRQLEELETVFEELRKGDVSGRVVLKI